MDYSGKIITKNPVEPSQTSAPGVWTLDNATQAIRENNWPIAYVPNPISRSLRFNSADSASLTKTPASAGSKTTWTWSGWVKRSTIDTAMHTLMIAHPSGTQYTGIYFTNVGGSSTILVLDTYSGTQSGLIKTAAWYRDPSAWMHIVAVMDTTNATSTERLRLYVNGQRITAFTDSPIYPSQNYEGFVNSTTLHSIGSDYNYSSSYFSGYMAETHFIDGQALDPTYFGMTDPRTGAWIPKKYSGTYGTNGFYLNFSDNSTTAALGTDYSGNSNTWTTNNFSVTAGSGNDSMVDVPTPWIPYNTTGDVGGVVRGNYCTMNGVDSTNITLSNGNLTGTQATSWQGNVGTFLMTSGKWYWEVTGDDLYNTGLGVIIPNSTLYNQMRTANSGWPGAADGGFGIIYNGAGTAATWYSNIYTSYAISNYLSSGSNGDILQVAFDADSGKIWIGKNNTWGNNGTGVGDPAAGTNPADTLTTTELSSGLLPFFSYESGQLTLNAGQRAFAYTPPAGFKSLCTTNLPEPTILDGGDYFNTSLWTGTNSTLSITGVGFQPDFAWIKVRNVGFSHNLQDAVRGPNKVLVSNSTGAEQTQNAGHGLLSFDSDGFTLGLDSSTSGSVNGSGSTYVGWSWKESATSGFDIVTYTGTGVVRTVNHDLGAAPAMMIIKQRNDVENWIVYHQNQNASPASGHLMLQSTSAFITSSTVFNNTAPTSSVFTVGTAGGVNTNAGTYVAYLFAAVPGYSAFGSYTGNGSTDGPFIYTGFRPAFVITKRADGPGTDDWAIKDNKRNTYNPAGQLLLADLDNSEYSNNGYIDFLSNGIKIRSSGGNENTSSGTYIYMAFAENPFKYSNAR